MELRALVFGTVAALAVTFGPAMANAVEGQEQEADRGESQDDDRAVRRLPAFGALDTDGDGEISAGEIEAAAESLTSLDEDGDGSLSGDELQPRRGGPIGGPARTPPEAAAAFMTFDDDGDGALRRAELPSQFLSLLTRADADGDGAASEAEILTLLSAEAGGEGEDDETEAADREGAPPGAEGEGERPRPAGPLMTALDADRDGALSAAEIASAARALRSLDADGDGRLTTGELRPGADGGADAGGPRG